jgi:iron-sulfur cluster assembly protein
MFSIRAGLRLVPLLGLLAGCSPTGADAPQPGEPALVNPAPTQPTLEPAPAPHEVVYLEITPAAAAEVRAHVAELKLQRWWLRYTIKGGGCTGFQDKLDLTIDPPTSEDLEFTANGIPCSVPRRQLPYMIGAWIDFGEKGGRTGFMIAHPQAAKCISDAVAQDTPEAPNAPKPAPTDR